MPDQKTAQFSSASPLSTIPVVHIVEDDRDLREGLACLLQAAGLHQQTHAHPAEFLTEIRNVNAGCLVIDIRLPGMSGIDLIKTLRKRKTPSPIIVMTAHADVPVTIQAFKLGAVEFLLKPFSSQEFLEAVNKALDLDQQRRAVESQSRQLSSRVARLNARDWHLIEKLRLGLPNKRIATDLGITERAVEMRRSTLLRKVNLTTLPELIELVTRYAAQSSPNS